MKRDFNRVMAHSPAFLKRRSLIMIFRHHQNGRIIQPKSQNWQRELMLKQPKIYKLHPPSELCQLLLSFNVFLRKKNQQLFACCSRDNVFYQTLHVLKKVAL